MLSMLHRHVKRLPRRASSKVIAIPILSVLRGIFCSQQVRFGVSRTFPALLLSILWCFAGLCLISIFIGIAFLKQTFIFQSWNTNPITRRKRKWEDRLCQLRFCKWWVTLVAYRGRGAKCSALGCRSTNWRRPSRLNTRSSSASICYARWRIRTPVQQHTTAALRSLRQCPKRSLRNTADVVQNSR